MQDGRWGEGDDGTGKRGMAMNDLEREMAAHGEQIKTLFKEQERHGKLLESIHSLSQSVSVMASSMQRLQEDVKWLRQDVDQLEGLPGKRWEGVVSGVLGALVGGLAMLALARMGFGQ